MQTLPTKFNHLNNISKKIDLASNVSNKVSCEKTRRKNATGKNDHKIMSQKCDRIFDQSLY